MLQGVYHSTLGSRVIIKKKTDLGIREEESEAVQDWVGRLVLEHRRPPRIAQPWRACTNSGSALAKHLACIVCALGVRVWVAGDSGMGLGFRVRGLVHQPARKALVAVYGVGVRISDLMVGGLECGAVVGCGVQGL